MDMMPHTGIVRRRRRSVEFRFFMEAWIVSKRSVLTGALILVSGALAPELVVYAQEPQAAAAATEGEAEATPKGEAKA